jgi:cell division protein FtsB
MSVKGHVGRFLSRFKYIIVIIIGVAIVGFVDENSYLSKFKYDRQIKDLRAEIDELNAQFIADSIRLSELDHNPAAIEKIARERYFMKADDEEIFVLSDDIKEEGTNAAAQ